MSELDESFLPVFNKALHFLAVRPRSTAEMRQYLKKRKIEPSQIELVIAKLIERKYLNDLEFAAWFLGQRARFRPKAQQVLKFELKQKGVPTEIIAQALEASPLDEVAQARQLVAKKQPSLKRFSTEIQRQKLSQFLARRGFNWSVISQVLPSGSAFDADGQKE